MLMYFDMFLKCVMSVYEYFFLWWIKFNVFYNKDIKLSNYLEWIVINVLVVCFIFYDIENWIFIDF